MLSPMFFSHDPIPVVLRGLPPGLVLATFLQPLGVLRRCIVDPRKQANNAKNMQANEVTCDHQHP